MNASLREFLPWAAPAALVCLITMGCSSSGSQELGSEAAALPTGTLVWVEDHKELKPLRFDSPVLAFYRLDSGASAVALMADYAITLDHLSREATVPLGAGEPRASRAPSDDPDEDNQLSVSGRVGLPLSRLAEIALHMAEQNDGTPVFVLAPQGIRHTANGAMYPLSAQEARMLKRYMRLPVQE